MSTPPPRRPRLRPGAVVEIVVEKVAHGGHFVGRVGPERQVVFVRHTLPGEVVSARVTEVGRSFARADAVEVLEPSPHRVKPPCRYAGTCGGCDFQHVDVGHQRELKRQVVVEALQRIGRISAPDGFDVLDVSRGDQRLATGLGWRTRQRYRVADGRIGMYAHRSHTLVELDSCLLAAPGLPDVLGRQWPGSDELFACVTSTGKPVLSMTRVQAAGKRIHEQVGDERFELTAGSFWQTHPNASTALVDTVLAELAPRAGERAYDLFCGAGLFARFLARAGCRVTAVEGDRASADHAENNLADFPDAQVLTGDVAKTLRRQRSARADLVVLDPPRAGAGTTVVAAVAGLRPRRVVYVACDPAAMARDLAEFGRLGFTLSRLHGFDLFPMTQHVECVALLQPTKAR